MNTQQKVASVSVEAQLDELMTVTVFGESWSARDLMLFAGYGSWRDFVPAIREAMAAVNVSGVFASDHFRRAHKLVADGAGGYLEVEDVNLTRYGCHILFQGLVDSRSEVTAAQQYFVAKTSQAVTA